MTKPPTLNSPVQSPVNCDQANLRQNTLFKKHHLGLGCPGEWWICENENNEVKSNLIKFPIPYFTFFCLGARKEKNNFQNWFTEIFHSLAFCSFALSLALLQLFSFNFLVPVFHLGWKRGSQSVFLHCLWKGFAVFKRSLANHQILNSTHVITHMHHWRALKLEVRKQILFR